MDIKQKIIKKNKIIWIILTEEMKKYLSTKKKIYKISSILLNDQHFSYTNFIITSKKFVFRII